MIKKVLLSSAHSFIVDYTQNVNIMKSIFSFCWHNRNLVVLCFQKTAPAVLPLRPLQLFVSHAFSRLQNLSFNFSPFLWRGVMIIKFRRWKEGKFAPLLTHCWNQIKTDLLHIGSFYSKLLKFG